MNSANPLRRPAGNRPIRAVAALLAAVLGGAVACRADDPAAGPPLPPVPEDLQRTAGQAAVVEPAPIRPTAFEPASGQRPGSDAPLPLSTEPTTPGGVPAGRPLPPLGNWSLLLAIGGVFVVLGVFRLRTFRQAKALPPDVFELLGSASLGGPHAVRVVRFGPRTLLVGISSAGCQTLAEIDDPQATERIVSACRGDRLASRPVSVRTVAMPRGPTAGGEAA